MAKCIICGSEFYYQTECEPAEPCACGFCYIKGDLWWDWRSILDEPRYYLRHMWIERDAIKAWLYWRVWHNIRWYSGEWIIACIVCREFAWPWQWDK